EPDPETLWLEARSQVRLQEGVLVLDDTVLDKPHARHIDLVGRHWSGKHKKVVQGIDLVSLVWTDGDRIVPCDYRVYHDAKPATKTAHCRAMVHVAHARGLKPHVPPLLRRVLVRYHEREAEEVAPRRARPCASPRRSTTPSVRSTSARPPSSRAAGAAWS